MDTIMTDIDFVPDPVERKFHKLDDHDRFFLIDNDKFVFEKIGVAHYRIHSNGTFVYNIDPRITVLVLGE
jgi:hypothetical protein|tara:strand:- start:2535 stop:2744 length:210 start_codon:yes stop_codon:yes gene_type:complete